MAEIKNLKIEKIQPKGDESRYDKDLEVELSVEATFIISEMDISFAIGRIVQSIGNCDSRDTK